MEKTKRLTKSQKDKIIKEVGICEIATCWETENLVVHHIRRISSGGTNDRKNLKVFCEHHHKMLHPHKEFR